MKICRVEMAPFRGRDVFDRKDKVLSYEVDLTERSFIIAVNELSAV